MKNRGGAQASEQNVTTFSNWVTSKTFGEFKDMTVRGQLSRTEIAKECGFAKSVLQQNPRVKEALNRLEQELRENGVLPPLVTTEKDTPLAPSTENGARAQADKARLKRLETENASLRAEVMDLRQQLERYQAIDEMLCSAGRMPR